MVSRKKFRSGRKGRDEPSGSSRMMRNAKIFRLRTAECKVAKDKVKKEGNVVEEIQKL